MPNDNTNDKRQQNVRFNKTPPKKSGTYAPSLSKTANPTKSDQKRFRRIMWVLAAFFAVALIEIMAPRWWQPVLQGKESLHTTLSNAWQKGKDMLPEELPSLPALPRFGNSDGHRDVGQQAVILMQVQAYETASHFSAKRAVLGAGTNVKIVGAKGEWRQIAHPGFQERLWVPANSLLVN